MRVLLIEDDTDTQEFLIGRFKEKGVVVDTARTGTRGIYFAKTNEYDAIFLDYGLPEKNGMIVCEEIRALGNSTPIIMISVTDAVNSKVRGLALGADDYITKPFYFEEVYARMQAILRRPQQVESTVYVIDDLKLDATRQIVSRGNVPIYLTKKEFAILEFLLKHSGEVVTRGMLMEHIWDLDIDPFSNTIETHMLNLRKKIEKPEKIKLLHSITGRGYKIGLEK